MQELQNKEIGIVPRDLFFEAAVFSEESGFSPRSDRAGVRPAPIASRVKFEYEISSGVLIKPCRSWYDRVGELRIIDFDIRTAGSEFAFGELF